MVVRVESEVLVQTYVLECPNLSQLDCITLVKESKRLYVGLKACVYPWKCSIICLDFAISVVLGWVDAAVFEVLERNLCHGMSIPTPN